MDYCRAPRPCQGKAVNVVHYEYVMGVVMSQGADEFADTEGAGFVNHV